MIKAEVWTVVYQTENYGTTHISLIRVDGHHNGSIKVNQASRYTVTVNKEITTQCQHLKKASITGKGQVQNVYHTMNAAKHKDPKQNKTYMQGNQKA